MEEVHGDQWHPYLETMALKTTYGDHQMLQMIAIKLKRDIFVVTSSPQGGLQNNFIGICGGPEAANFPPILLGHRYENHYETLKVKGTCAHIYHLFNIHMLIGAISICSYVSVFKTFT